MPSKLELNGELNTPKSERKYWKSDHRKRANVNSEKDIIGSSSQNVPLRGKRSRANTIFKAARYNENKAAMKSAERRDDYIASPAKRMRLQANATA